MLRRTYETYIAPDDPFISHDEFDALDYKGKGEAIFHLYKHSEDGKDYADNLCEPYDESHQVVFSVCMNNYAKRFFPPANPLKGEMPAGMPDLTPNRPTMRAVIPAPSARRK